MGSERASAGPLPGARCVRRHGVHDEEEAIQVRGPVLPRGTDGGALRLCSALRKGPSVGRGQLSGSFEQVSSVCINSALSLESTFVYLIYFY